ncbi:hypothetical protein LX73_1330 [Fodinibius salinus]|uniref:Uncharacterized protein n=1 Tax=Fodinibius salinus TaxID=860790 RepID=A0A5D3YIL0_9BACT|nr:hypothetical protein [Fodinibius salinus]TYP93623.1 hypothetical protein LX73_1330 [Fodinibius salinus]
MKFNTKDFFNLVSIIFISLFFTVGPLVQKALADFYVCRNNNCATYIIEDSEGFSWHIECMDGTMVSGRTSGAEYGGNCKQMTI